jgi:hypothetical protein
MARHGSPHELREKANGRPKTVCAGPSPARRFLCFLVLLVSLGCAHRPPSPLTEATKAHLGTIGVVANQVIPEIDYRVPGQGGKGGAAIGAAKGVGLGMLGAVGCAGVFAYCAQCVAACGLALATPYFAVRYAVDQATKGVPADTIDAAETAIKAVLAGNPQAVAREALYRVAAAQTGQPLVLLPDPEPATPPEASRYQHLAAQGIDTVLEITVQRIALRRQRAADGSSLLRVRATDLNPSLTLVVTTRRRVVRTAEGTVLYDHAGEHTGRSATFTDWGANDAQLLRDGLDQLFQETAREIVSQVFGVTVPLANEPAAPATPHPAPELQMPASPPEAIMPQQGEQAPPVVGS